ncbi:MAG: hypothetical protein GY888_06650, partial [Planctomycetaceae bacterium]|nr:hypothetical protein [Planctomycetaceae bacterium]
MMVSTDRFFLSRVGMAIAVLGLLFLKPDGQANCLGADRVLRAGAVAIDVTPLKLPVIINGSMVEKTADKIVDRLHARCLVLDDGTIQVAIVVVDSCMMPRKLLDHAK